MNKALKELEWICTFADSNLLVFTPDYGEELSSTIQLLIHKNRTYEFVRNEDINYSSINKSSLIKKGEITCEGFEIVEFEDEMSEIIL